MVDDALLARAERDDGASPRYASERLIARGGFCDIFRAVRGGDGLVVALKKFRRRDRDNYRMFCTEARVMLALHRHETAHSCVVRFLGAHTRSPRYVLVYEIAESSLDAYVRHADVVGGARRRGDLVGQLVNAVRIVHGIGFAHRDIKPANVLVFRGGAMGARLKLADFGMAATCVDGSARLRTLCGSPAYMAPELHRAMHRTSPKALPGLKSSPLADADDGYLGWAVDIWALGAVVYEIFHRGVPVLLGKSHMEVVRNLMRGRLRPCRAGGIHPLHRRLLAQCLTFDAERRPTAVELRVPVWKRVAAPPLPRRSRVAERAHKAASPPA